MTESEVNAARDAKRRYYRRWRAKNKDKIRASNLRYWAERAKREAEAKNEKSDN